MKEIDYEAAIEWLMAELSEYCIGDLEKATLTEIPTKERFFEFLPDMDYEIMGGTWENPLWAWMKHPWYKQLNLNKDECIKYLQER
jgi:hypothetical protein